MPGIYDITDKTYIRPADMIDESLQNQIFQKYAGDFSGKEWWIPHKLESTNLLVELWKYDQLSPAAYYLVSQLNSNNLLVKWTMPVTGKAVVYSVRDFVGVSMVYKPPLTSQVWTIYHNFGTRSILVDVWADDGTNVVPTSQVAVDDNTLEITFNQNYMGTAVLLVVDPKLSQAITLGWDQIVGVPTEFPPSPHTHGSTDMSSDTEKFKGKTIDEFVLASDVGVNVAPLEKTSLADPTPRIPERFLPLVSNMKISDANGSMTAQEFYVDSSKTPLYIQKQVSQKKTILSLHPVVTKTVFLGNLIPNPSLPHQEWQASSDFLTRLKLGKGLEGKLTDQNTLELSTQQGLSRRFTKTSLNVDDEWTIKDIVFDSMANYSLNLYETYADPTEQQGESLHVKGVIDVNAVFQVTGSPMLSLFNNNLSASTTAIANHFVCGEDYLSDGYQTLTAPSYADALYYDSVHRRYITRSNLGDNYAYYTIDTLLREVKPLAIVSTLGFPVYNTVVSGYLYTIQSSVSGNMQLLSTRFDDVPLLNWSLTTDFPNEILPPVGGGTLIIRITGSVLYILNTGFNTLHAYSRTSGVKLYDLALPKLAKSFDVWPDHYISMSFVGEPTLYISLTPGNIAAVPPSFVPSVDMRTGSSTQFVLAEVGNGSMSIMPDGKLWWAQLSSVSNQAIYATGTCTAWLKTSGAWTVNNLWSLVTYIEWENYDLYGFDEVKIAFYPGVHASLPSTLYYWDGTGFVGFPAIDLPLLGQPIDVVKTMTLQSNDVLSYVLYLKREGNRAFQPAFITQNFVCKYRQANIALPVPISGTGKYEAALIKCVPGLVIIKNTTGHNLLGVTLVAVPAL